MLMCIHLILVIVICYVKRDSYGLFNLERYKENICIDMIKEFFFKTWFLSFICSDECGHGKQYTEMLQYIKKDFPDTVFSSKLGRQGE